MSVLIEFNEMKLEEESQKVKNNRPERLAHFSFWIPSLALALGEVRSTSRNSFQAYFSTQDRLVINQFYMHA